MKLTRQVFGYNNDYLGIEEAEAVCGDCFCDYCSDCIVCTPEGTEEYCHWHRWIRYETLEEYNVRRKRSEES